MRLDPLAAAGFAHTADAYQRGRPGFPPEAVAWAIARLGVSEASTVLDLAAGTGRLTRAVRPYVAEVVAVEPLPGMRAAIGRPDGVRVLEGTAEAIPLLDASVDAVVVGDAFHWFRGSEALAEIHRVLRPGRGLALIWNVPIWKELPWNQAFVVAMRRRPAPGVTPQNRPSSRLWRQVFQKTTLFEPLELRGFPFEQRIDRPTFLDQVSSWSYVAALPDDLRRQTLDEVAAVLDQSGIGAEEQIVLPHRTDVYVTRARSGV
ncbi:MAG: class I SAM-dependent methyltransferase [Gaiellales bacterium]